MSDTTPHVSPARPDARPSPAAAVNDVTVLVFKDNYASRTFRIPLSWISRFGFALGACAAVALVATVLAVRYYRTARNANPVRVQELETELDDLHASYKSLESKLASAQAANGTGAESPAAPAPTVTVTTTPAVPAAATVPVNAVTPPKPVLFSALPISRLARMPDPATLPFKLVQPKVQWRKNRLSIALAIQYTSEDGGNQQGRIVILARGGHTLTAYPDAVMNAAGAETLLAPAQGEYFSVSRFREVRAEFGPLQDDTLKTAEVLIFDTQGDLLMAERFPAEIVAAPRPAPPRRAAPAAKPPAAQAPAAPSAPDAPNTMNAPSVPAPAPAPGANP
jgi:hypothetical protein